MMQTTKLLPTTTSTSTAPPGPPSTLVITQIVSVEPTASLEQSTITVTWTQSIEESGSVRQSIIVQTLIGVLQTSTVIATSTSTPRQSLDTGQRVGIGVGAALGLALIIGILFVGMRRNLIANSRRHQVENSTGTVDAQGFIKPELEAIEQQMIEKGVETERNELPGDSKWLDGGPTDTRELRDVQSHGSTAELPSPLSPEQLDMRP